MTYEEIVIEEDFEGERIDKFLAEEYENLSRSYIQKLITSENVQLNGKTVKANYRLSNGDLLKINIPELEEAKILPENIELHIRYEDQYVIVVNKRKGMVVHPAPGNYSGTLVNALMANCKDLSGINGVLNFAPIQLKTAENCIVSNVNLETELENLIYFVNALQKAPNVRLTDN